MTDRAYTVKEIDGMRAAIEERSFRLQPEGRPPIHWEKVEALLRTYMIAGVEPDDLYDEVDAIPIPMMRWYDRAKGCHCERPYTSSWVRPTVSPTNMTDHAPS